ncbi:metabotropic glutamate receptor 2-like [Centruroides sculpturatus]|uniref:metabotropic glutamate receptor 2-like n=1 Tax=Centruroides sculpturatus TaxID=218467 RepID=UPI000C6CCB65|nr:metabotropic glutamate receptor 2-like [Centruroides sculpturatus]
MKSDNRQYTISKITTCFILLSNILNCVTEEWAINNINSSITWPVKKIAEIEGDIILGGLMMVHEREDLLTCGPIMPQGGIQALECMLYTIDWVNSQKDFLPNITLGAYVLDDCDKDTYGLEQAVDFIKGETLD